MFDVDDIMVLAYRLKRPIERKPLACAKLNDYFLAPTDKPADGKVQILSLMDHSKVALVRVVEERSAGAGQACSSQNLHASMKETNNAGSH